MLAPIQLCLPVTQNPISDRLPLSPTGSLAQKRADLAPTVDSSDPADVVLPRGTLPDKLVRIPVRPADEEEEALAAAAAAAREQTASPAAATGG